MNRNVFKWNGAGMVIIGFIAVHITSKAFGDHFVPTSTPEAITDLICSLDILAGYILFTIGQAMPKKV